MELAENIARAPCLPAAVVLNGQLPTTALRARPHFGTTGVVGHDSAHGRGVGLRIKSALHGTQHSLFVRGLQCGREVSMLLDDKISSISVTLHYRL